jgi:aldehyde dehydrogenase family protein
MQTFTKVGLDALLTPENCVLVLIDHQPSQLANVNSHDPTMVINNVTALARTKATTCTSSPTHPAASLRASLCAPNHTMYGLTSSILSGNTYKALEMAPKVLAGIVNVNSPTVNDEIQAPMDGVRDSGWGRTGPRSLDDFSDVIWINSHSGQRQYPF